MPKIVRLSRTSISSTMGDFERNKLAEQYGTNPNKTEQNRTKLNKSEQIWTNLNESEQIRTIFIVRICSDMFGCTGQKFLQFRLKPNKSEHFFLFGRSEQIWTNLNKIAFGFVRICSDLFGFVRICSVLFRSEQNGTICVRRQMPNKSEQNGTNLNKSEQNVV